MGRAAVRSDCFVLIPSLFEVSLIGENHCVFYIERQGPIFFLSFLLFFPSDSHIEPRCWVPEARMLIHRWLLGMIFFFLPLESLSNVLYFSIQDKKIILNIHQCHMMPNDFFRYRNQCGLIRTVNETQILL